MSNQKLSISKLVNIIKTAANDINGANGIFLILSLFAKSIYTQYTDAKIKDKTIKYRE